ncbi:hypothetical protein QMZ92_06280 [Streptomyces sp. HNM0645]|uniref:hypothetical protein n=1 Tax=Streptomyces sp. HNM0645 TaxID=2782343 RepID=UPI0024B7A143|nr:hypothetical protein [Streptomyces sp. HNM0645]MDI9884009.1 hypothetical protein [Streptomyces sp. HNM0645]
MTDLAPRLAARLRSWLDRRFPPGAGTGTTPPPAPVARPAPPLLAHRSPYGLDGPLDGDAGALVRPYLGDALFREAAA